MEAIKTFMRNVPINKARNLQEEFALYKISVKIFIKNVQTELKTLLVHHKQEMDNMCSEIDQLREKIKYYENESNYSLKNYINKPDFLVSTTLEKTEKNMKKKDLQLFSSSLSRVQTDKTILLPTPTQINPKWKCFQWRKKQNQYNPEKHVKTIDLYTSIKQPQHGLNSYSSLVIQEKSNQSRIFQALYSKFHSSQIFTHSNRKSRLSQKQPNQNNLGDNDKSLRKKKYQNQQCGYEVRNVLKSIRKSMGNSCENISPKKSKVKINPFPCTPEHRKINSNKKSILKNKGRINQTLSDYRI